MSNQLGQIYGTVKNAETYIILNSENVELSGNVYINGGLVIDNSFGISGEVLISQGSTSSPIWRSIGEVTDVSNLDASSVSLIELSNNTLFYTPPIAVTDVSNLDASSVSLIELSNNTLFYTPIDISGYQLQLDVLQNAPSGSGSLTLINNPTGGTLNRLSYTPPVVTGSTKRYASSSINQAISSGQQGLTAFSNFVSQGISSSGSVPFTIQSGGAGYYQLTFLLNSTASTQFQWNYITIYKNGSVFQRSQYYTPGVTFNRYAPHGGGFIIYLAVNDFMSFEAWSSASHTITGYVSLNLIS